MASSLASSWKGSGSVFDDPKAPRREYFWSVTIGALEPDTYAYSFIVDGLVMADPRNSRVYASIPGARPQNVILRSIMEIPGDPPLLWEHQAVPHGTIHEQRYYSKSLGVWRRLHVYTPPDYERTSQRYPVLYLLHGAGGDDTEWTSFGRAPEIADNLLAQHRAKPMIIVMPNLWAHLGLSNKVLENLGSRGVLPFFEDFIKDVIPTIESTYRVKANRENRAIIGNSMGGVWSVGLGLIHRELFAWVGSISGLGQPREVDQQTVELQFQDGSRTRLQALPDSKSSLKLLWFSFGREEPGIDTGRQFSAALKTRSIAHQFVEAPGGHPFENGRPRLCEFLQLLFTE